jgi:hypothetical protein
MHAGRQRSLIAHRIYVLIWQREHQTVTLYPVAPLHCLVSVADSAKYLQFETVSKHFIYCNGSRIKLTESFVDDVRDSRRD